LKLDSLHELYVDKLKRLYEAEHQSLRALPKMAGNPVPAMKNSKPARWLTTIADSYINEEAKSAR
jgi:Domain of unknown function (DUF892)